MASLVPVLSPHGALHLKPSDEAEPLDRARSSGIEEAFARGAGHGLLQLGAEEVGTPLPPLLAYWRDLGARYVTALCALPGLVEEPGKSARKPAVPPPAEGELNALAAVVPPMIGAEYLTSAVLADLWRLTDAACDSELAEANVSVQEFLKARHPAWNLVGRVHFNLAENRNDEEAPF